jgi:hypothetical protein
MQPALETAIDQIIGYFNARKLDLPDGFFDRRTQFVVNGAPFETLLGRSPTDPLVLMLTRGPAGFRFAAKALQHAIPDARLERGEVVVDGDSFRIAIRLWVSGRLRGTGEAVNALVPIALTRAASGQVEVAEATVEEAILDKIREARLRA